MATPKRDGTGTPKKTTGTPSPRASAADDQEPEPHEDQETEGPDKRPGHGRPGKETRTGDGAADKAEIKAQERLTRW